MYDGWWGDEEDLFDIARDADDVGYVETVDGCIVEPDGICEHGFFSPLLEAGLI